MYIHRSLGLYAMMQILSSEKFPQTRLTNLRVFWLPAEASPPLSNHPSSFKDSIFFHSHRKLRYPFPQGSQHTSVTMCTNLLLSYLKQIASCNWLRPKIIMLSTELQTEQRLHKHSLPKPCFQLQRNSILFTTLLWLIQITWVTLIFPLRSFCQKQRCE